MIAHNDMLAIDALRRFSARGIRVRVDVSGIGVDAIFGADFCTPPLTTPSGPSMRSGALWWGRCGRRCSEPARPRPRNTGHRNSW
ncbi:substrate-binding domain-containing protein [Rhodococcus ruber]|uniref:substrate-binding domain-containing protein n=1 Tax=Rhodococcus ruber TaxID=1830 RepID=UPI003CCB19E4